MISIDIKRLQGEIDALAAITEVTPPAVTRVLFSEKDLEGRAFVRTICEALGLTIRVDAVGNFFARWEGTDPELPAVASGSHIDAIPNAGRYDGVLGVLGVLEAFRALKESGFRPKRSLELIVFTAEEPTRFGLGCLGSRLMGGALEPERALPLKDKEGTTLEAWLQRMDWPKESLESVRLKPGHYRAFVELHIEQGPILEREGLDIGAVEKIAAPSSFRFKLEGVGGHAGGVLMPGRRDALLAACEMALEIEKAALESGSPDTVATTGVLRIEPGAINSIPCRALMEVDMRDTDVAARGRALERVKASAAEICQRRGIEYSFEAINADPPAIGDPELVAAVVRHAETHGYSVKRMISRAYHDSLFMALVAPLTMIFIPCLKGMSHRPDEFSSMDQMERGVRVLADMFKELAS